MEEVEATLHQYELEIRHESARFGLNLILNLSNAVNHGVDLNEFLKIGANVDRFRQEWTKDPAILQSFVQQFFLVCVMCLLYSCIPSLIQFNLMRKSYPRSLGCFFALESCRCRDICLIPRVICSEVSFMFSCVLFLTAYVIVFLIVIFSHVISIWGNLILLVIYVLQPMSF